LIVYYKIDDVSDCDLYILYGDIGMTLAAQTCAQKEFAGITRF